MLILATFHSIANLLLSSIIDTNEFWENLPQYSYRIRENAQKVAKNALNDQKKR